MKNDAGTTEGVEYGAGLGAGSGEIEQDLGEFWGEHTNEGIASGAGLVAFGVGGDVLGADGDAGVFAKFDDFDMISLLAKLIMM